MPDVATASSQDPARQLAAIRLRRVMIDTREPSAIRYASENLRQLRSASCCFLTSHSATGSRWSIAEELRPTERPCRRPAAVIDPQITG